MIQNGNCYNGNLKQMRYPVRIKLNLAMLVLFAGLFLMGKFCDKAVAETLYSPDNILMKLITSMGVYPFYSVQVLFWGALCERALSSEKSRGLKVLLGAVCFIAMILIGYIGARSLVDRNNLGSIFPVFAGRFPAITVFGMIFEYPLFLVGYFSAKKSDDRLLVYRITGLFTILLTAYLSMQVLKNLLDRPRYRTAVLGYEGIEFVPWYKPFEGAEKCIAEYCLNADEFRSFPSGHSIFSSLCMCILPSLSWLFPKLRSRQMQLFITGFVFSLIVMTSRMILGAHYLSDISAGAVIGVFCSAAFAVIQLRTDRDINHGGI